MKPKLIIILNRLVVGGQTIDTLPLLNELSDEFDILVLHGCKEKDEKDASNLLSQYPSLKSKYIPSLRRSINPFNDAAAFFAIYNIIKKNKPNIVHTHGSKSGFVGRLAAYASHVPVIIHTFHGHLFHSYYNSFFTAMLKSLERMLGKITSTAIALSHWQKKELCEVYKILPPEKVKVIHLGIELDKINVQQNILRSSFRKKYNVCDETIVIGLIGRIVPIKNVEMFVKVAKALIGNTISPLCFFIIGDGYLKKRIPHKCSQLQLSWSEKQRTHKNISVVFTSWIEEVLPAFHALDVLALTSHNEGTPMSVIEAQCCGKPVVATNVGGVRDTLLDGETGFLVQPNDINAMAEKLKLLANNSQLRNEMGSKAKTFAAANFSKQKEVRNFRALYRDIKT